MTIGEWLAGRTPEPPPALRARIDAALGAAATRPRADAGEVLVSTAETLVATLLAGDAMSRDSALDLLAADALVTYAFEAGSEMPHRLVADATRAMERLAALAAPAA